VALKEPVMSNAVALPPPVAIAAFDAFIEGKRDDSRWEPIDGEIVAMTDPSLGHAEIVGNINGALRPIMPADRRSRVTAGDARHFGALVFEMKVSDIHAGVELHPA
jgi:Uma2 family endonuclease